MAWEALSEREDWSEPYLRKYSSDSHGSWTIDPVISSSFIRHVISKIEEKKNFSPYIRMTQKASDGKEEKDLKIKYFKNPKESDHIQPTTTQLAFISVI